ncbi:ash family protein [Rahnella perminowiae]
MVAQAGLTSVRPVASGAGILTPVWATTQECENSSGSFTPHPLEIEK